MSKFDVILTVKVRVDTELTNTDEILDNISVDVNSEDFSQIGIVDSEVISIE